MKKKIIIFSLVIAVFVAVAASGDHIINRLLTFSGKSVGRNISTNEIDIDWGWPVTRLHAANLSISNYQKGTEPTMLFIEEAIASIRLSSLFDGTVRLPEVVLNKPQLLLEKDMEGNANWHFNENPAASTSLETVTPDDRTDFPVIDRLRIKEGNLTYRDPKKKTDILMKVDTIQGKAAPDDQLHFTGKGRYQDRPFTLDVLGGNVFKLKETDEPYPLTLNMKAGETEAHIEGTVLDPITLKGIDVQLDIKGADAAELFTLIGMALPPTPPYHVTGHLDHKSKKWNFENFKGRMGDSDLRGSLMWDRQRERPLLTGTFISENLDFDDLGGFIGATPSTKRGETASAEQKEKAAQKRESPYVIPETPLDISRLAAMDANVTFTGKKLISQNLPLDDFYMKVELQESLLKLVPVRFGTAKGDISANMTVNARQEPVKIKGDFIFSKLSLKPIFEKIASRFNIKNVTNGYIGGTAQLEGTGKSLRQMLSTAYGDIGLGMEGGQLSNLLVELLGLDVAQSLGFLLKSDQPVPIRCMIGDFSVKNGIMKVRRFVIDTTDSNITGKGSINLKNEKMDMTLYTQPKDTSILSLNSPIRMQGTLKDPHVNVKLRNIVGRGAAAAAVGVAIFPVVGLVAFIEPGLGKDSQCGKLIQEMEAHADIPANSGIIPKNKSPVKRTP